MSVRRPRVQREIVRAIAGDILSGRYPAGGALPRENDLCAEHGVSRTVIREVLKVLEAKGLVDCRPRVGTTVRAADDWNILDAQVIEWLGPRLAETGLIRAILETRRSIEPMAAELAAGRASLQEIADLEAAWRAMAEAGTDIDRFSDADLAFHQQLLIASHNRVFRQFGALMQAALKFVLTASNESVDDLRIAVEKHGHLVEALRMRDGASAHQAALALIDQAERDLTRDRPAASH